MRIKSGLFETFFTVVLLLTASCASERKVVLQDRDGLVALHSLPLKSDSSEVVKALGKPSKVAKFEDGSLSTYSVLYNGDHVPKITLWLDLQGKLVSKTLNLIADSQSEMKLPELFKYLGPLNLESQETNKEKIHYIPSKETFIDEHAGVLVEIDVFQDQRVDSITWYKPDSSIGRSRASEGR